MGTVPTRETGEDREWVHQAVTFRQHSRSANETVTGCAVQPTRVHHVHAEFREDIPDTAGHLRLFELDRVHEARVAGKPSSRYTTDHTERPEAEPEDCELRSDQHPSARQGVGR